jgi:hypothetical protein
MDAHDAVEMIGAIRAAVGTVLVMNRVRHCLDVRDQHILVVGLVNEPLVERAPRRNSNAPAVVQPPCPFRAACQTCILHGRISSYSMSCQQNVPDFCLLPTAPRPERSK